MKYLVLEFAEAHDAERWSEDPKDSGWVPAASSQGESEEQARALMLENVLEMLNDESLNVNNAWLRLKLYGDDHKTVEKVEVF